MAQKQQENDNINIALVNKQLRRSSFINVDQQKLIKEKSNILPKLPQVSEYCTLKFEDGTEIKLPVYLNSEQGKFIDVQSLYNKSGCFTYDPGFSSTASCMSSITHINGELGQLLHRGYNIEDLSRDGTYMELCYLLIYGELPSIDELKKFEETVVSEMMVHQELIQFYKGFKHGSHPMAILTGVVGALSAFDDVKQEKNHYDPTEVEITKIKIIAKMPTIAAISFRTAMGLPIVYPKKEYSYIENFLYMLFSNPMEQFDIDKDVVRAIDMIMILHADHEQNASTSTVRIAGSSLTNPYACIAAGIASLWGPAHGGANEACVEMLEEIENEENIPLFLEQVKKKERRLMGFGHRVYKNYDPRAKQMAKMCHKLVNKFGDKNSQPFLNLAIKLEQTALNDDYFSKRLLFPNVDFYTGCLYKQIGIPKNMYTVMFAVSRAVGWITQWSEMVGEEVIKIGRPRQLYVGHLERQYIPIEQREEVQVTRIIPIPKLNKFTKLMIL